MAYKDLLLQLSSYPEATTPVAVEQAVSFAKSLDARITALTFEIEFHVPPNPLALALLNVHGMVAAERSKSVGQARELMRVFDAAAAQRGVASDHIVEQAQSALIPELVAEHARLRDLTVIPIGDSASFQQYLPECVIFNSGRPVLVLPETAKNPKGIALDAVAIAWDFSRPAARAIADALPILQRAKTVRAVTFTNEKKIQTRRSGVDLVRHLACHGVDVVFEEENVGGQSIGRALEAYVASRKIDLLVMGAYGHSRMRDFVLGGATKSMVASPPLPVLLSH